MIEYKQVPNSGTPLDVELITDDRDAELANLQDLIDGCGFEIDMPKDQADDGKWHIIIPGSEVGDFSNAVMDIDNGALDDLTDQWNQEAIAKAEEV